MYDREEEQAVLPTQHQPLANTTELAQELKNTVFLMSGLYQQLQEERSVITSATGQMTHAAKQFEGHIRQFGELERQLSSMVTQHIQKMTEKAVNSICTTMGEVVAKAAAAQSEAAANRLTYAIDEATNKLHKYTSMLNMPGYFYTLAGISIGSGIACALGMHFLFRW